MELCLKFIIVSALFLFFIILKLCVYKRGRDFIGLDLKKSTRVTKGYYDENCNG